MNERMGHIDGSVSARYPFSTLEGTKGAQPPHG